MLTLPPVRHKWERTAVLCRRAAPRRSRPSRCSVLLTRASRERWCLRGAATIHATRACGHGPGLNGWRQRALRARPWCAQCRAPCRAPCRSWTCAAAALDRAGPDVSALSPCSRFVVKTQPQSQRACTAAGAQPQLCRGHTSAEAANQFCWPRTRPREGSIAALSPPCPAALSCSLRHADADSVWAAL